MGGKRSRKSAVKGARVLTNAQSRALLEEKECQKKEEIEAKEQREKGYRRKQRKKKTRDKRKEQQRQQIDKRKLKKRPPQVPEESGRLAKHLSTKKNKHQRKEDHKRPRASRS